MMWRTVALAFVSVGWAAQVVADCVSAPIPVDGPFQDYAISNQCGVAVSVPFETIDSSGDIKEGVWEIPACFKGSFVKNFSNWEQVRFLPPTKFSTGFRECYRASAHPRGDVQLSEAITLLESALECPIPRFVDDFEGTSTVLRHALVRNVDIFGVSISRTVAVNNEVELWMETFQDQFGVAFSQLASAVVDGNGVVLTCAEEVPCIATSVTFPGDCSDKVDYCQELSTLSTWRLETCDAGTARMAAIAIIELIRGNKRA